ncbi:MAG: methyltransferase [Elusimicrobia bacterium CG08_land_8_20_14_0_20_59_10]|nr:MAG: methyltransferase [Elusimicrobia bacterium CG08_land_8_20_14_0_20_59_10]
MPHVFDPGEMHKLDAPERRDEMPPEHTLLKAGLRPRDIFLDIGCGTGYFAIPATRVVGPRGKILACDVSQMMLAELRSRAAAAGIFNIDTAQCGHAGEKLPEAEATMALLADVLHEVEHKGPLLAALRKSLVPGARLAIIEWRKEATPHGPPPAQRLDAAEITKLLDNSHYEEPSVLELGKEHLLYLSKKP